MMKYTYEWMWPYLRPLFKHTIDVYRAKIVTDENNITREDLELVYGNVEAYVKQDIRAPFLAQNRLDTLRVSGMYNVHVPTSCKLMAGDLINMRLGDTFIGSGYCSDIRFGTAFNRCHVNVDDLRQQNPPEVNYG